MRILMLGWFGSPENSGGMEVHMRELCKNLVSRGNSIILATPKNSNHGLTGRNVKIAEIKCKLDGNSISSVIKNIAEFNKNIVNSIKKFGDFEIIQSHDWLCVSAAKALSEKSKKPWVHTIHSLEHIRAGEETKSRISKIEKEGIMHSDKIIAVSNLMKNEILKKYKISGNKIEVIRNYIGVRESGAAVPRKRNTVLFVGRLCLQKGVEMLISAFPAVLKSVPDAKLIIAGDGNLKDSLKTFSKIGGIEKSVVFMGYVCEKKLHELYQESSVFVSPSVYEPFGITILDAAYFGAPVIATKNTGALEIFDKNSLIVIEPQNKTDIAEKIIMLLSDERMQKELTANAKKDILAADDWEMIAEKTEEAYNSLLN